MFVQYCMFVQGQTGVTTHPTPIGNLPPCERVCPGVNGCARVCSLSKSAFWLIFLKPLDQLKNLLWLANIFYAIFHPLTWIQLYFSTISWIFFPYGQNLRFWLKFWFDFYIFILIYILQTVMDMQESSAQWVYLSQEKKVI